jgi:1-acyl-sn-glycerol-3-phosphate acyltransferase
MKYINGSFANLWKLYIAIIFSIFAIIFYPFLYILLLSKKWKKISFKFFIVWSWCMRIACFYRVKKVIYSKIHTGPYIIVSNHVSYLDIFLMYSILPKSPFVFLGKSEILSYPIIRTYFKNLNIPVYRNDKSKAGQAYSESLKSVNNGWSLVIFPEGTIPDNEAPKMLPFKNGAFKLAKALNIPILPLTFENNHKLFSDQTNIWGPARPGLSIVHIHDIIPADVIQKKEVTEISEMCFEIISKPLKEKHPELY